MPVYHIRYMIYRQPRINQFLNNPPVKYPRISLSDMSKQFSIMEICGLHFNLGFGSGFQNSKRLWTSKTEKMSGICFPISLERKNESSITWMSKSHPKFFLEPSALDLSKSLFSKTKIFFQYKPRAREKTQSGYLSLWNISSLFGVQHGISSKHHFVINKNKVADFSKFANKWFEFSYVTLDFGKLIRLI